MIEVLERKVTRVIVSVVRNVRLVNISILKIFHAKDAFLVN